MSIKIVGMSTALPGENFPGKVFTGRETRDFLYGKKGKRIFSDSELDNLEKKMGIEKRNIVDQSLPFPSDSLAYAAAKFLMKDLSITPLEIDGLFFITSTPDGIFPPPGTNIANALELKPKAVGNTSMACSSLASALETGCDWINSRNLRNVLIVGADVTSRLRTPNDFLQSFLFGDAGLAMLLEKNELRDNGGFITTDNFINTEASHLIKHKYFYSKDLLGNSYTSRLLNNHHKNDLPYRLLGDFDIEEWPRILIDAEQNSGIKFDKVIPPQVSNAIINSGMKKYKELTGESLEGRVIKNSFPIHGNTGVCAQGLAWYEAIKNCEVLPHHSVGMPFVPLGAISTFFAYDPNLKEKTGKRHVEILERTQRPDPLEMLNEKLERLEAVSKRLSWLRRRHYKALVRDARDVLRRNNGSDPTKEIRKTFVVY